MLATSAMKAQHPRHQLVSPLMAENPALSDTTAMLVSNLLSLASLAPRTTRHSEVHAINVPKGSIAQILE